MTNEVKGRQAFKSKHPDPRKQAFFDAIEKNEDYLKLDSFRQQCLFIKNNDYPIKITRKDIAFIFGVTEWNISYHLKKAYKEQNGNILKNGRPFSLNETQLKTIDTYIKSRIADNQSILFRKLMIFCQISFDQSLSYNTMHNALKKLGYETIRAKPLEANDIMLKIQTFPNISRTLTNSQLKIMSLHTYALI